MRYYTTPSPLFLRCHLRFTTLSATSSAVRLRSYPQNFARLRIATAAPPRRIITLCKIAPPTTLNIGLLIHPSKLSFPMTCTEHLPGACRTVSKCPRNWLFRVNSSTHWKRTPSSAFQIVYFSDFVYVHASLRQNLKQNLTA